MLEGKNVVRTSTGHITEIGKIPRIRIMCGITSAFSCLFYFILFYSILSTWEIGLHACLCNKCMPSDIGDQKNTSGLQDLELQLGVSYHVGPEN